MEYNVQHNLKIKSSLAIILPAWKIKLSPLNIDLGLFGENTRWFLVLPLNCESMRQIRIRTRHGRRTASESSNAPPRRGTNGWTRSEGCPKQCYATFFVKELAYSRNMCVAKVDRNNIWYHWCGKFLKKTRSLFKFKAWHING